MAQITGEQKFQRTGLVSDAQIKKVGELTGAQYILVAEAVKVDEQNMFITAKILNVETAKMEVTDNCLMGITPSDIQHGCESLANKLLGISPSTHSQKNPSSSNEQSKFLSFFKRPQPTEQAAQAKPIVVDEAALDKFPTKTFPDGTKGIVFYTDKNKHGLAVALDATTAKWEDASKAKDCHDILECPNNEGERMLTYALGSQYTTAIVNEMGTAAAAASWCWAHGNGWYLPSAGELWYLLSVANNNAGASGVLSLAIVRAGGQALSESWYWSSTEKEAKEAVNVSNGGWIAGASKTSAIGVRAIRAF